MNRALFALLLLVPMTSVAAHVPGPCDPPEHLIAKAGNQRVDLSWEPAAQICEPAPPRPVAGYEVRAYRDGELLANRTVPGTSTSFLLTNGQAYAFVVYARDANGTLGPASAPVAATPQLDRDLQYLAAGLIVTWLAIFGYAAFLARREAVLDRKLEQLLQHRGGRNP